MKMKYFFLIIILFLFIMPLVYASCTITLDKSDYIAGETATAAMSCSEPGEKNTPYNVNWTNSTGYQFELDYGTTPAVKNQLFYQSFIIPATWPNGVFLNASINGSGIIPANNDTANVTALASASASSLLITNHSFGGGYIGLVSSIKAMVKDENGKKVSGGFCKISGWSNDETRMLMYQDTVIVDGEVKVAEIMPITRFNEGTDYAYKILCYCGSNGSATECIDEDGTSIENSIGSTKDFFTTNTWLVTTTSTDLRTMELKQTNTISVNVTNNAGNRRVPLEITYDCRIDQDNNYTRRIRSPFYFPECQSYGQCIIRRRGISANTTQEQGIDFIVEEHPFLQGRTTTAYCSTQVNIIDIISGKMIYSTISSAFNITSNELNIQPDWQWVSDTRLNSIVNLSASAFDDYNGTVLGNIDLQLHAGYETTDITHAIELINLISNITVSNTTDNLTRSVDYEIEFTEEDHVEIEIRNVNLSKYSGDAWWNITLDFYDLGLREVEALEGIESKTGTFHLDVNCPPDVRIQEDMTCTITAYIEDPQLVNKEVDFTCYITDGVIAYSSLNFNQMITRTSLVIEKDFFVPPSLSDEELILQCHADYYNFGSRRDSFYDSFRASNNPGSKPKESPITGGAIEEGEGIIPFVPKEKEWIIFIITLVIAISIFILIKILRGKQTCFPAHKNKKTPLKIILISLCILSALVAASIGIYYLCTILGNSFQSMQQASVTQNNFTQKIIWGIFIVVAIIILFKSLHIRGEIKFGADPSYTRIKHDAKISKLQKKINRSVLKDELKRRKINPPKIKKVRIKR